MACEDGDRNAGFAGDWDAMEMEVEVVGALLSSSVSMGVGVGVGVVADDGEVSDGGGSEFSGWTGVGEVTPTEEVAS